MFLHYTFASFTFEAWMTKINCTTLGFLLLLFLLNINPLAAFNSIAGGDDKTNTAPTISKLSSWEAMTESGVVNAEFRWLFFKRWHKSYSTQGWHDCEGCFSRGGCCHYPQLRFDSTMDECRRRCQLNCTTQQKFMGYFYCF